jgi:2-C-methyl-D-erythritol 2,4-cyclodiphosphate synthase
MLMSQIRIGNGFDVHCLKEGRKLILGGVSIPFDRGLDGHSDADVLCHAIADSLLGAARLGDIGLLFPDTDPDYKDANSLELLKIVGDILSENNFKILDIDCVVAAQAPKLSPYRKEMRQNIAKALNISKDNVGLKATTTERLGFVGKGEGIAASAICLVKHRSKSKSKKAKKKDK